MVVFSQDLVMSSFQNFSNTAKGFLICLNDERSTQCKENSILNVLVIFQRDVSNFSHFLVFHLSSMTNGFVTSTLHHVWIPCLQAKTKNQPAP